MSPVALDPHRLPARAKPVAWEPWLGEGTRADYLVMQYPSRAADVVSGGT